MQGTGLPFPFDFAGQQVFVLGSAPDALPPPAASGPWTVDRMVEMRFQSFDAVDRKLLREHAARFDSPRLLRAVTVWCQLADSEREGGTEL